MTITTSLGVFTDSDLWMLKEALATITAPTSAPPATGTSPPAGTSPPVTHGTNIVVPSALASRQRIVTPLVWSTGRQVFGTLNENNVWLIPFTAGTFAAARLSGAEFQDQATTRFYQLIRNYTGDVIGGNMVEGTQMPSFVFTLGTPPRHSNQTQLFVGEHYTLVVWNKMPMATGSGKMLFELDFQL